MKIVQGLVVLGVVVLSVVSALPTTDSLIPESKEWESHISQEVDNILRSYSSGKGLESLDLQDNAELSWTVNNKLENAEERPRPPKLDQTIHNLRGVMDRLEQENVNAVANKEALESSYAGKRAELEAMLAPAQQAIVTRQEQRRLCEKEVIALTDLDKAVAKVIERAEMVAKMRSNQSTRYLETTKTLKSLTEKNIGTLQKVQELLSEEIRAEDNINGAMHFDPVALRQRTPEDMLNQAVGLSGRLGSLMNEKLENQSAALREIKDAFACEECDRTTANLKAKELQIKADLSATRAKCESLAESHRAPDEADREKVIALKKDLEDIDQAQRVHDAAAKSLEEQRKQAEHVAQKMVGFYQNIPRTVAA